MVWDEKSPPSDLPDSAPLFLNRSVPGLEAPVRLLVARCEVRYSGRLNAVLPEAVRLLRPGGRLAFLATTPILMMAEPLVGQTGRELLRDYFGMYRFEWPDDDSVEFQLPYGEWIRLFRANGLMVEDLIELRPPQDADTTYVDYAPLEWARAFPGEHIWKVRKASDAGD